MSGNVTIDGSGVINLDNTGNDYIYAISAGDTLTVGADQTIQGGGNIGLGQTNIVNNGTLIANNATPLVLQTGSGTLTNNGTIKTVSGGALQFSGAVTSSGTVDIGSGTLTAAGGYTQTGGNFLLAGGSVQSSDVLDFQAGLIDARGSVTADIMNNATLRPALGGSGLAITGNVSLLSSSNLSFQLGGLTQGSQYSYLNVNGTVALSGNLVVSFANGFENSVSNSDTFTLVSSNGLSGSFTNIASGNRLDTSDGFGSFLVTYSGDEIILSNFAAVGAKFGPPDTIPGTYLIDNTTVIQTDPTITTNGNMDSGKIYRDNATDGARAQWLFGSVSTFDTASGFEGGIDTSTYLNQIAVFKFQQLFITDNPTISTAGGVTSLGFIGIDGLSADIPALAFASRDEVTANGVVLDFSGIDSLLLATQNGSIYLGSALSFENANRMFIYARGAGSDLTIDSDISTNDDLRLYSEGTITINGNLTTLNFSSFSGGDFTGQNGLVTSPGIYITSQSNIVFDAAHFSPGVFDSTALSLNATGTVSIDVSTDQAVFSNATSVFVGGNTINVTGNNPTTIMFNPDSMTDTSFSAGTGGIQASTVGFNAPNLMMTSDGDINVYNIGVPGDFTSGTVTAAGSFDAVSDVTTGSLTATNGDITVGGLLFVSSATAGGTINANDGIRVFGGSLMAGVDIMTAGSLNLDVDNNGMFGNITAGGDIDADGGIFTPGDPCLVMATGTIRAPAVITGTLQAGQDIFVGDPNGSFAFGIVANQIVADGTLNLTNAPTISPNNGGSSGNDGETFDDLTMTVGAISSTGPTYPVLSSNGGDADLNFADSNPGNGGNITLDVTAAGLHIGDQGDLASIFSNGGAFNPGGPYNGGSGGTVDITTNGDVVIDALNNDGPAISATTGTVSDDSSEYGGNGGTVNVRSTSGAITVNGQVLVSSDDNAQAGNPGRESASGGNIDLQSDLTAGTGITVGASGSLLSYLGFDALNGGGTPGSITLSTLGADIVVNGTVRADFGTITIDQATSAGPTPTITLDGATLQGAVLNINGSGDLTIGPNNSTAINIFSGSTWNVAHDITINAANTGFAYAFALNATAGNAINFTGGSSGSPATLTLPLSGSTTFTAGAGGINAQYTDIEFSGADLNLVSGGDVTLHSINYTDNYVRGSIAAVGTLTVTTDLNSGVISAASISAGGDSLTDSLTSGSTIDIGGRMSSFGTITANGAITAGTVAVPTIVDPNSVLTAGSGGIHPFVVLFGPGDGPAYQHTFNLDSIVSPNGIDFSGNQFGAFPTITGPGGKLTINATTLTFNPTGGIGTVNFNGADAGGFGSSQPTTPGDGGTFIANATGDITTNSDSPITATTGLIDPNLSNVQYSGAGGAVELNSDSGTVSVDSTIQVSSAEPTPGVGTYRSSESGGNITVTSGKSTGVAIDLSNSTQLLSLLHDTAPGPGGTIMVQATGASSEIDGRGTMEADFGTVDIRQTGTDGAIVLGGTGFTPDMVALRGDIVKVGALGTNGTLTIGQGTISADVLLHLYAGGSNGTINFVADVTLDGNSAKIIAANTINIFDGVVLTINGPTPAKLYTNNPNFSSVSGGNDVHSGEIHGTAGSEIHPLSEAPGFDDSFAVAAAAAAGPTPGPDSAAVSDDPPAKARGRNGARMDNKFKSSGDNGRTVINVTDTDQLLDLVNNGPPVKSTTRRAPPLKSSARSPRHGGRKLSGHSSPRAPDRSSFDSGRNRSERMRVLPGR